MGPVSFESLDGGASRDDALRAAGSLAEAGIRVAQVIEGSAGSGFRLLVRSADATRAREILSTHA